MGIRLCATVAALMAAFGVERAAADELIQLDVNGDGIDDVYRITNDRYAEGFFDFYVRFNGLGEEVHIPTPAWDGVDKKVDINGDGKRDLLRREGDLVHVHYGTVSGHMFSPVPDVTYNLPAP